MSLCECRFHFFCMYSPLSNLNTFLSAFLDSFSFVLNAFNAFCTSVHVYFYAKGQCYYYLFIPEWLRNELCHCTALLREVIDWNRTRTHLTLRRVLIDSIKSGTCHSAEEVKEELGVSSAYESSNFSCLLWKSFLLRSSHTEFTRPTRSDFKPCQSLWDCTHQERMLAQCKSVGYLFASLEMLTVGKVNP